MSQSDAHLPAAAQTTASMLPRIGADTVFAVGAQPDAASAVRTALTAVRRGGASGESGGGATGGMVLASAATDEEIALYDEPSGRVCCTAERTAVTKQRTALVGGLATAALARRPVGAAVVLGAGDCARAGVRNLLTQDLGLRTISVYDDDRARAAELVEELATECRRRGVELTVVEDIEQAVRGAGLVLTVASRTASPISRSWLARGALVVNASPDALDATALLDSDMLVVDRWPRGTGAESRGMLARLADRGRVVGPGEPHARTRGVDAQLGDVLDGRHPGRRTDEDVIVVNVIGGTEMDLAVLRSVWRALRARHS